MSGLLDAQTIGPVDVAVFGFEGDAFNGQIAPALRDLVEAGTVRIIDLAFVRKDADGDVSYAELVDSGVADAYEGLEDGHFEMLNEEDLQTLAEDLEPATAAMVVVWENSWAANLAHAIRHSGGFVITHDRIPHEVVIAAVDALKGD